jgi:type II secretory pathway predicted ATPase ExeA
MALKRKKPVVLIVEEAHGLHHFTLAVLKRLTETSQDGGAKLDGRILVFGADAGAAAFHATIMRLICATRKPLIS